jgi:putative transcriptional regulator
MATMAPYHYTECGLDYVYLDNGFEIVETPYGRHVSIMEPSRLHREIGKLVVSHARPLSAQELRFLRIEMDLSIGVLSRRLGLAVQHLEKVERGEEPCPPEADRSVRRMYLEWLGAPGARTRPIAAKKSGGVEVARARRRDHAWDVRAAA